MATRRSDDAPCVCCGVHGHNTVDHIRPRGMGGHNTADNRQALCYRCNHIKAMLESSLSPRYRRAVKKGKHNVAEDMVRGFLEQWRAYCQNFQHGKHRIRCRCYGCLVAPIPLGAGKAG